MSAHLFKHGQTAARREFTWLRIRNREKNRVKKMAWFLYDRFCIHTGGVRVPCSSPAAGSVVCGRAHQAHKIAKKNMVFAWWRPVAPVPGFPRSRIKIASRNISAYASSKGHGSHNWHFRIRDRKVNLSVAKRRSVPVNQSDRTRRG